MTASCVQADDYITNKAAEIFVGGACIVSSTIREGQQAIGEVKGLREQNLTLQNNNQTLQNSLESATAQVTASQATEAAQVAIINNLTNNLAAAHIAKQNVEIASAKTIKESSEKLYNALQQISARDAALAAIGTTLAIGATAVVVYAVYCGASSYIHNRSKTAAQQKLNTCIEGDDASLIKSRGCEKEFFEFARYTQSEDLIIAQRSVTERMRTAQAR